MPLQYLEDNESLITSALQLLSQGRTQEATKLQGLLQRNLMWLASIADAQSQPTQPAQADTSGQVWGTCQPYRAMHMLHLCSSPDSGVHLHFPGSVHQRTCARVCASAEAQSCP